MIEPCANCIEPEQLRSVSAKLEERIEVRRRLSGELFDAGAGLMRLIHTEQCSDISLFTPEELAELNALRAEKLAKIPRILTVTGDRIELLDTALTTAIDISCPTKPEDCPKLNCLENALAKNAQSYKYTLETDEFA